MSYLGELAEIVKAVVELLKTSKPEAVVVVVLGALVLGALLGFAAHALWRKQPGQPPETPRATCPERHTTLEEAATLDRVTTVLNALEKPNAELWQIGKLDPPYNLLNKIHGSKMRVLTFANLKGGVGKTTLAANVAAYFCDEDVEAGRTSGYRVLLIDFDYQGSLSITALRAAGRPRDLHSLADELLSGQLPAKDVASPARRLGPNVPGLALIPADLNLSRQENRLLVRHLLVPNQPDPRYSLVRLLADDLVLNEFDLVVIDTPPRLTLGTVAGLSAATHVVIPTILDGASILNVKELITQLDQLFRRDLNSRLELAGIVGVKTDNRSLNGRESKARTTVEGVAQEVWGNRAGGIEAIALLEEWPENAYVFPRNVPETARFHEDAGNDIAYLDRRRSNADTREHIAELGR